MPVTINIRHDGSVIEFIASGVVTGKEIVEANEKIYTREHLLRLRFKIIDRSACTDYDVTTQEMETIARQDLEASKINRNITVLLVSSTDLQFGMTRMWQALTENTGFRSEILRDRESADQYINARFLSLSRNNTRG